MELAQPSCGSAAAAYPRWVLLGRGSRLQHPSTADAATLARCYGSTGCPVQVSFRTAAPPAVSTLHAHVSRLWQFPGGGGVIDTTRPEVLAAHGDSVLLKLAYTHQINYFVYSTGAGCARPPSLSLLPAPCRSPYWPTHTRSTGILRPGGGVEFVVANLNLTPERGAKGECLVKADLFLLRSGQCAWELCRAVPVRHADGQEADTMSRCMIADVIPVGDRFLCWIIRYTCILLCDVTAVTPELRYVPLPDDPFLALCDGRIQGIRPQASQNVCVTGGGHKVKFVRVSPRCCCGGPGATACARSRGAFTVTTWTLTTDDMTWKEDGVVDSDELWAAAVSDDVPRVPLEHPVVSMDDPDVVFFVLSDPPDDDYGVGDKDYTLWVVTVDMKRKTMRSVCRYPHEDDLERNKSWLKQAFLPSEVSSYFNTTHRDGGGGSYGTPASSEAAIDAPVTVAANPVIASPDDEGREILAVIREIPGMAPDEMLRAHGILAGDDRRVRVLKALPVDMRKEYCMLELERNLMRGAK